MDTYVAKSRSYEVQRTVRTGSKVKVLETLNRRRPINGDWSNLEQVTVPRGTVVTLETYTNAGFRGIEASIILADGSRG